MESTTTVKKGRVRWDEQNLSENEQLKKEMNTTAIEEPKTPFHSPCASHSDLLAGDESVEEYQAKMDAEMSAAGMLDNENSGTDNVERPRVERRVSFDIATLRRASIDAEEKSEFKELRRQHYSMRDALKRGKDLIEQDGGGDK